MAKLFSMRMKGDDKLQDYTNRFAKYVKDCNFSMESHMLAKFYRFTLLAKNQQMMINQMSVRHDVNYEWTINEIYECVLPLFVVDEQTRSVGDTVSTSGKRRGGASDLGPTKVKVVKTSDFFCAKHGGAKENHNTEDCRSYPKQLGIQNRPFRATSAAAKTRTCYDCGKPRFEGHWCQEHIDAKRCSRQVKSDIQVHMVKTKNASAASKWADDFDAAIEAADPTPVSDDDEVTDWECKMDVMDAEGASHECKKSKHESFNPF